MLSLLKKRQSKKPLIGVEFSVGSIAVAQVSYDPDQMPRLLLCESNSFSKDQNQSTVELSKVYKLITKKIKSNKFIINATMHQEDRQLLLIEAPQVDSSELTEAARWKVKDMIDYQIENAIIDVIEIPNIKELKRSPMIYAVVVKREKIQQIVELCNCCGNELSIIDIPDMAQRNFAALLPEDQNGVAILSINATNSLLTITRKGELYLSRELETGFEQLMPSVHSTEMQTDSLNTNSEVKLEATPIAMPQSLERMVLEIQRSLDYYEAQYNQPQINNLFLAPFAYDAPEIKDYFSSQLGVKTTILDLNVLFATDEPLSQRLQSETFYAVGAALR